MGYDTYFKGFFRICPDLRQEDALELDEISNRRHEESDRPGYWCKWGRAEFDENGNYLTRSGDFSLNRLAHNGKEKFYSYTEWLQWLIDNFFKSKGYILNGSVIWQGQDVGDVGTIVIKDNTVRTHAWADLVDIR